VTGEQQLAAYILTLLNKVQVEATDASLQNTMTARQWLGAISRGELVVAPKPEPKVPDAK